MIEFLIAASLFGMPVTCQPPPVSGLGSRYQAYYLPRAAGGPHIGVHPRWCKKTKTWEFAGLMAHELAHNWQDIAGLPFDERQADLIGGLIQPSVAKRLGVKPPEVVKLSK